MHISSAIHILIMMDIHYQTSITAMINNMKRYLPMHKPKGE